FGRVHVFDAGTGDFAFTLQASDGFVNSGFGGSLALCGDILAVGAYDLIGFTTGAVYLYDLDEEGTELRKLTPSDGAASDWFGRRLAMDGGRLLVGAEFHQSEDGAAYLYDIGTGNLIRKLTAPNSGGAGRFGGTLALSGNLALIAGSEPYLVDVRTGGVVRELSVADNATSFSPSSVSLCGNLAVLGNSQDDDLNTNSGAAYFFRPLAGPLPLTTITQRGNSVGNKYPDTEYRAFPMPAIGPDGEVNFCANLSGPGSGGGRDKLIASTLPGIVSPLAKSRDPRLGYGAGVVIQTFRPPIRNRAGSFVYEQFLRGPGITPFNRHVIVANTGSEILRTGIPIPALNSGDGDPEALTFTELTHKPNSTNGLVGIAHRLRRNVAGVTATNDSGIILGLEVGSVSRVDAREGNVASTGDTYGQFFGRVAQNTSAYYAHAGYMLPSGGGTPVQQCFSHQDSGSTIYNVARQGEAAPLGSIYRQSPEETATFRTILGEGMIGAFGFTRARIVRSGNRSRNEGIWREGEFNPRILKGEEFDAPGTYLQRILRFWPVGNGNIVMLIKLSGPAVNPGNDCALAMLEKVPLVDFWNLQKLVREGDAVCDWDCPRVRAIQRVDVDPINGNYAVVVSLTGSPARNQALLTGNANLARPNPPLNSGDFTALRRPNLILRKGTLYNTRYAQSTRLRSIVMEPRVDRTGSGGKGLGQVINENGEVVLCLQFDDGAKELVVGKP
ncbi:MAG: hypothetical protein KDN20_23405, partial [Verrucomicrobiae bacterium]|nr:hypothetical protein [Verrucomicrobiae bacterium]